MNTGWKIVQEVHIELLKKPSGLPIPGLAPDPDMALLLVTARPLQGRDGLGTISSLIRSVENAERFVLAHFTGDLLDEVKDLPDWFLGSEGAKKRNGLFDAILHALPLSGMRGILTSIFYNKKMNEAFSLKHDAEQLAVEAKEAEKAGNFHDHLRIIHLAIDRVIEAHIVCGDSRNYTDIVADGLRNL